MESLPPISRTVRLIHFWPGRGAAARWLMSRPTSFDPVKAMKRVWGCSTRPAPKLEPEPGQKFTTPSGILASCKTSKNLAAMAGESWERLHDTGVPAEARGCGHARHDRAGKIPRRNHRAYSQRDVHQPVAFTR